ncbi:dual serine/threonine and tyrosine protein kinase isoform X1 [Nasonia vitripennis]|uniref:Dual serine/threonine and tyrosine protein kinase n=1 Tax=Nasonia vitripennis TaxID=7425 RepID=A0A7M7H2E4_NASVI|nr:dual serine/threonine and tyrosine protein kinase isoform X1 [Nasonia vitripennis]XP_008203258.1 dual serine/threonine and tyrosine protein kinase isoform X1 [Nasonia vitripennis]
MVTRLPQEFRRYNRNRNQLRHIFKETQRVLEVINLENFFPGENIIDELLPTLTFDKITHILENCPAIVIFGQNNKAKATLVNRILSTEVLPVCTGSWRWIKIGCGPTNHVNLTLGLEYEVVENLLANEKPWVTIPAEDLVESGSVDPNCPTVLEVKLNQPTLKDGVQIFVVPDTGAVQILAKGIFKILPIFLYALGEQPLSNENMEELRNLKETYPYNPILFVSALAHISFDSLDSDLSRSETRKFQIKIESSGSSSTKEDSTRSSSTQDDSFKLNSVRLDSVKESDDVDGLNLDKINSLGMTWLDQLTDLGFMGENVEADQTTWLTNAQYSQSSDLLDSCKKLDRILYFVRSCLQTYLVNVSNYLNDVHTTSLRKFILSAFDMAREIQITPKRIQYAQQKENELYANLMKVVNAKQEELTELIQNTIQEMKDEILLAPDNASNFYQNVPFQAGEWSATVRAATTEVQRIVLTRLGERVAKQLVNSVNCLRDTFVGTLQRCLLSLEKSYEHDTSLTASDALKQILSAAYNVELHNSSPSLVHSFLERMRQLLKSMPLPWAPTPILNASWRRKVTIDVLNSLSAARLARTISTQFRDKVKASHDTFQSALRSLENHYSGKLERTEEQRIAIRKYHAPRLAKLALESTSMSDMVRFGIPHQGKEIGRGQYGVVFACDGWGGAPGPCAVKSVVPPDEKHWNDLAMEFYYTRSIPNHKRIVKLRGSVIDHTYGGGYGLGAAVLLITDRMSRDLYCGIRSGLEWLVRIQIAIDVLEGIRYLHSQGLVHRDIKLKNVLLDPENRAKLTDLGFCITEAMMSGSIVGTPVHMAPELLSGHYDSSVDVYAFGILFWYICAGHVRLPYAFEQFHNKEQLWTSVRKGIRPERLIVFDDECWNLMEQCWAGEPSRRPLLGAILPVLESIQAKAENGYRKSPESQSSESEPRSTSPVEQRQSRKTTAVETKDNMINGKSPRLNNNYNNNNALALLEPNNQRGEVASPIFVPSRRKKHHNAVIFRTPKHPSFPMTNFFHTSACSNLYIQMHEF